MNTIITEHADNSTTAIFEALAKKLGLPVKAKPEKENIITNPDIIDRIEKYESGNSNMINTDLRSISKLVND